MIEYINGKLTFKSPTYVVIECAGVGYHIHVSLHTFSKLGNNEACKLLIHQLIREDAHLLYGFTDNDERNLFRQLLSVSGVGASTAQLILSSLNPGDTRKAIMHEDVNLLKSVKGIGAKTAQRIILDLKDKISKEIPDAQISVISHNTARSEALSALIALGFDHATSSKVLDKILTVDSEQGVEALIKAALKSM